MAAPNFSPSFIFRGANIWLLLKKSLELFDYFDITHGIFQVKS
jgi:hypothetical protein